MDVLVALATFGVIFPAELPDKSMFAAVALGARFAALPVWLGLAAAFLVHVLLAVAAGGVLTFLPHKVVASLVTVLFAIGAGILLFKSEEAEAAEGEREAASVEGTVGLPSNLRVATTAFGIVFISEWGDLTQLAVVNLTARYDDPLSVGVGALAALWLVTGLGVLLGRRLVQVVPMKLMRRIAGMVLLCLTVLSAVALVRS